MNFSIIGTGNIAWFFGSRLAAGHHKCTGVYARNINSARQLAEALMCDRFGEISDVRDGEADVCFLTVSDAAVVPIAEKLNFKKTILVHTAGAIDMDSIKRAATNCAVLWPVYSILKNNQPAHRNIPCAWEASTDRAAKVLLGMAHAITDNVFEAKYEQRKWMHLAAVMSNNFITHLIAICEKICAEHDLPFSALTPIIDQTFNRIKNTSAQASQTGPAIRKDESTISSQLDMLNEHPHWQMIYKAMTESIQSVN